MFLFCVHLAANFQFLFSIHDTKCSHAAGIHRVITEVSVTGEREKNDLPSKVP